MNKEDPLRLLSYLEHILEALTRIFTYIEDTDEIVFLKSPLIQDAVIRNLEVIGEAARNIQRHHADFLLTCSEIPWEDMIWMRNRLSHGYFSIDFEIVWKTLEQDLPPLYQNLKTLYQQFNY